MDGLIIVNKESGLTSFDVIRKLRKIFHTKKVGHLGTLDPLAKGVLVVCLNDACKLVQFLENDSKEYIAKILIGLSTNTYDLDGEVIDKKEGFFVDDVEIDKVLETFKGEQMQFPPIYSAIKVNGKKLYEYARKDEEVEIKPRLVNIFDIKRTSKVTKVEQGYEFTIRVSVSKGTYIRSLCYDIGKKLLLPSVMSDLVRVRSGIFTLNDSFKINDIENGQYKMVSIDEALSNYVKIDNCEVIEKAIHGMKISFKMIDQLVDGKPQHIVIKRNDKIVAIYERNFELYCYKALRVWN